MLSRRRNYISLIVLVGLCIASRYSFAVKFEPGVGFGFEYTDNAKLTDDNELDDLIAATYVGGTLFENEGALQYDATASFNKHNYTKDSYADQRYFNLSTRASWEMIKRRFDWFLTDYYNQRPVVAINSNTPDNLQDTNAFTFGANIHLPVTGRQNISIVPKYDQYYYEALVTDNRQYSISTNWNYSMFRRSSIGVSLSSRKLDYIEAGINDTRFINTALVVNGFSKLYTYEVNMGSTNVKRDNGGNTDGFSGFINLMAELSSRSKLTAKANTSLTDTSSISSVPSDIIGNGNGDGIQVSTDVVRNASASLGYTRDDATLHSNFWLRYTKLTYSDNPFDRVIRSIGIKAGHPINGLLSTGAYINYNRTRQIDSGRLDEHYTVGGNLNYNFSRKLHGLVDLKYRTKESSVAEQNYEEASIFASLVYGFGNLYRPTRAGGF